MQCRTEEARYLGKQQKVIYWERVPFNKYLSLSPAGLRCEYNCIAIIVDSHSWYITDYIDDTPPPYKRELVLLSIAI